MKTFNCVCGGLIFFENISCVICNRELGFLPDKLMLSSLEDAGDGLFSASSPGAGEQLHKKCQNFSKRSVCNWMIPATRPRSGEAAGENEAFCVSCRLNQTIPDLSREPNLKLWHKMETAKHRLVYTLLSFKLPVANKSDDPEGLAFAVLEDQTNPDGTVTRVMTGHENGLITLNIAEADDSTREKIRNEMGEPLRTLLGHFRHEVGHYYWDRLMVNGPFLERFRKLFGTEEADYQLALEQYYSKGAPSDWQENYISAYATAHPWEDWAETWAHLLHIQDTLEVANDFGLVGKSVRLDPAHAESKARPASDPRSFEGIINSWAHISIALNSINRAMGLPDLYPFVLSPVVIEKLRFVFEVIAGGTGKKVAASSKA